MAENHHPPDFTAEGLERACQVETYSGARLHERPRRFTWEGQWLEVSQVLATWRTPYSLHFQVAAADSRIFLLQYEPQADTWTAQPGGRQK